MSIRLNYYGGAVQEDRMIADKLRSLKKSLKAAYQAETAGLPNGDFKCLINPNKLTMELDDKILSIPFKDIPVEGQEELDISLKVGDVIEWKETGTHWILYQRYLQENAYYRFAMRQCDTEIQFPDGTKAWAYVKGPDEKGIDWTKTKHLIFNNLNYTLEIYISKTTETLELLQRFTKIKMYDRNWEVQAKDDITTEGIIVVYLKEDYENKWAQDEVEEELPAPASATIQAFPHIEGPQEVYPYDIIEYQIIGAANGEWGLSNKRARILSQNESSVKIEITTGKSGDVSLIYRGYGSDIIHNISILSL